MIQISTLVYMDIGLFIPENILESAKEIRWGEDNDGTGLLIEWIVEDTNSGWSESQRKLFSWEELGIVKELFYDYGRVHIKPYHPSWRYLSSVLVARWGEEAIRAELPAQGSCCQIIATDGGYVGQLDARHPGHSPGYAPGYYGWGVMIFSPDGLTWQRIDAPVGGLFQGPEDCNILCIPWYLRFTLLKIRSCDVWS